MKAKTCEEKVLQLLETEEEKNEVLTEQNIVLSKKVEKYDKLVEVLKKTLQYEEKSSYSALFLSLHSFDSSKLEEKEMFNFLKEYSYTEEIKKNDQD